MATVTGILETSLYVADLERSRRFYERVLGFEPLLGDERMCGLGVAGRQVLLLFLRGASDAPNPVPGGVVPPHDGSGRLHVAFAVRAEELGAWRDRLSAARVEVEATVHAPRGGDEPLLP